MPFMAMQVDLLLVDVENKMTRLMCSCFELFRDQPTAVAEAPTNTLN
jgi:hypothetical protein